MTMIITKSVESEKAIDLLEVGLLIAHTESMV